ncbi:hypothetical protein [Microbacterium sp. PMB16]|uniref:hypothetical protein n=1 Tax=Microbacterium sp. PMB16 TaxID=3120157 RepID=UPI003F4B58ED
MLDALLSEDFPAASDLRQQAENAQVARMCDCGCPSIDFVHPPTPPGLHIHVNAWVPGDETGGLFLYTEGRWLGGIEYVPNTDVSPDELPDPRLLHIEVAG